MVGALSRPVWSDSQLLARAKNRPSDVWTGFSVRSAWQLLSMEACHGLNGTGVMGAAGTTGAVSTNCEPVGTPMS